jgi:lipocalin-like protein
MKKWCILSLLLLLSVSCQKQVEASAIQNINGYWEIEKVVFEDGSEKIYNSSETYDYFKIIANQGFRKKVTPQFDGSFLANDSQEDIVIREVNGKYYLNYSTSFAKWKEELVSISAGELVTINDAKNEYHYKRAFPINIISNGKKAQ